MWVIRAFLIAVLVIALIAFAYFNIDADQKVEVNLVLWGTYVDVPLITVVFWAFVAGVAFSLVLFASIYVRQTIDNRAARRRIRALENEVTVLRNRPIEESADLILSSNRRDGKTPSPFAES